MLLPDLDVVTFGDEDVARGEGVGVSGEAVFRGEGADRDGWLVVDIALLGEMPGFCLATRGV